MKKNLVLIALFILPIVAYLFFATGVHSFTTLPVITKGIPELGHWETLDGKPVKLQGNITVMAFGGKGLLDRRGNFFNLNQKIYQRYHEFKDLQFVVVCPEGTQAHAEALLASLKAFTDIGQWRFVFAPESEIQAFYAGMHLRKGLEADLGTEYVFLVDKQRNLRGRNGEKDYKESYSAFHPSELSNEMLDDFKILLYEYRKAFKSNNTRTQKNR